MFRPSDMRSSPQTSSAGSRRIIDRCEGPNHGLRVIATDTRSSSVVARRGKKGSRFRATYFRKRVQSESTTRRVPWMKYESLGWGWEGRVTSKHDALLKASDRNAASSAVVSAGGAPLPAYAIASRWAEYRLRSYVPDQTVLLAISSCGARRMSTSA